MKKIYFACSIRGGRDEQETYHQIVSFLKDRCELLSEIFADSKLTFHGSPGKTSDIWQRDLELIRSADAIIAEVTVPSLGVGYEIAKAEEWKMPILGLFNEGSDYSLSAMIDGSPQPKIIRYQTIDQATAAIEQFLAELA